MHGIASGDDGVREPPFCLQGALQDGGEDAVKAFTIEDPHYQMPWGGSDCFHLLERD